MTRPRLFASLPALLAVLALAACGSGGSSSSSSESGRELIKQTFGNAGKVRSGQIAVGVELKPEGLAGLTGPITFRFAGPFDKPNAKATPRFRFRITGGVAGQKLDAGVTSTGDRGFVALSGRSYALSATQFAAFRKSFDSVQGLAQPKTTKGGDIPWLKDPKVQGDEDVDGVATNHVSAGVDIDGLAGQLGGSQGSAAQQRKLIDQIIKNPRFDFYTGKQDKILRRVRISLLIDVPESVRSGFGGLRRAPVTVDFSLSDVNRPQTITAPTNLGTAKELNQRLQSLVGQLSAIGSLLNPGASTGSGSGSGGGSSSGNGATQGSAQQIQRYQTCLTDAAGDDAAIKRCLKILHSAVP